MCKRSFIMALSTKFFISIAPISLVLGACGSANEKKNESQINSVVFTENVKEITFGGGFGGVLKNTALSFAPKGDVKSALVVSPGADIPPSAMSGFAQQLAGKGVAVYVVKYLGNKAILQQNLAYDLVQQLNKTPEKIQNLQPALVSAHKAQVSTSLFGHSLGGAVKTL
jgi:hypothetical protein